MNRSTQPCGNPALVHATRHSGAAAGPSALVRVGTRGRSRRGVASVLAMMFIVIFSSLAAAMAVVAQGNLRTADSSLKLSRAMSAAETGLVFASRRLAEQAGRFVVEKGVISSSFADDVWMGTYNAAIDGAVTVLPANFVEGSAPSGLVHAVRNAHLADTHSADLEVGDSALPSIDAYGTLRVKPVVLSTQANPAYFRLTYELVSNEPAIRVTSIGVDGDIRRELQMDFRLDKKIEFAILSPNRIMIGKNVLVEGPLGTRYGTIVNTNDPDVGDLNSANGDPLVMRSDFHYLNATLDGRIDVLYQKIRDYDADGDNRLRPNHPAEAAGLTEAYLIDYDGDGYVDDFDLFLAYFDANNNHRVIFDTTLASEMGVNDAAEYGTGAGDDLQLLRLIDNANPDRDGDGVIDNRDRQLGYNDGIIDIRDLYAKVRGRLAFAVKQSDWELYHGASYRTVVHGPVRPAVDVAPAAFEVTDDEMRSVTTDMFTNSQNWFNTAATGTFGVNTTTWATIAGGQVPLNQANNSTPYPHSAAAQYIAPNAVGAAWESVPFGAAPGKAYDYFKRPVFRRMTFTNVRLPKGLNGLFENCVFLGVTYIDTQPDCTHYNWNYAGARTWTDANGDGVIADSEVTLSFPTITAQLAGNPVPDTKMESNNIRFHNCTFLGSIAGMKPNEYMHWRNKVQFTGTTRFYTDVNDPDLAAQSDAASLQAILTGFASATVQELEKSSILMPGWSFDVGSFSNDQAANPADTPKVKLKGTVVAGIMDVRGTADVHGTMLMTFKPKKPNPPFPDAAAGPLAYGGMPDGFNTTIGYFGSLDGDGEGVAPGDPGFNGFGEITLRYNPDAKLPDGIPWPLSVQPLADTYTE